MPSRHPRRVPVGGGFEGDLGAGVSGANHQDATLAELRRAQVLAGVELHDPRIELGGEVRDPGGLVGARCHHHVVGLEPPVTRGDDVPPVLSGDAVHVHAGPYREIEARRVGFEVVGHLVPGWERPGGRGERPARQAVVPGGSEQAQRVPALAPGVPSALARLQDHELLTPPAQVIAHREARLPAADDHCLETLRTTAGVHPDPLWLASGMTLGGSTGGRHRRNQPIGWWGVVVRIDHRWARAVVRGLRRGHARPRRPSRPPATRRPAWRRCSGGAARRCAR